MSIGRRFWNMARSELNSLLDRARELDDDDSRDGSADGYGEAERDDDNAFSGFTDDELLAELARRRKARERAAGSATRAAGKGAASAASNRGSASSKRAASVDPVRNAYRTLELAEGADLDAVKKAYRTLMRKYHPDRHAGSKDKQDAAHELTTRITHAYEVLKRHLGERG